MRSSRLRFLVCVSALVLGGAALNACATVGPEQKSPVSQFTQKIGVDAARVEVANGFNAAAYGNDASSSFPMPLDVALRGYAQQRLQPAGNEGVFVMQVEDARVTREGLESSSEIARKMNLDKKERYAAMIRLKLFRQNPTAPAAAYSEVKVQRTWTIPANLSIAEREKEQNDFVAQLLRDVDASVTSAINNTLQIGAPLRSGPAGDPNLAPSPGPWPAPHVEEHPF